jgi:hypothetical protein
MYYCYVMFKCYCYICSVLCILFYCVVLCTVCVQMCTVLLPAGVNRIADNKYMLSFIKFLSLRNVLPECNADK